MTPIPTSQADYQAMIESFNAESDRGAAVLAGSYAENSLGMFLESFIVDPAPSERLFGSNGSLSTFSQRIDFAQAFGHLSKQMCAELHLIRKIRNHFAHHPKASSFSESPVREWATSFTAAREVKFASGDSFKLDDPRIAYLMTIGMLMVLMNQKLHGVSNPDA